jgi:transcriptional regulator with XRE-family HTH domain
MTGTGLRRLRVVREAQGKGLRQLAREVPMDPAYLSRVERGLQRPSLPVLLGILKALGLKDSASAIERVWDQ